jgi:hypothetical protein
MFVVKTHTYILLWGLKTSKHIRVFGIAIIYRREYTYMFFFQAWSYLQKKQKTRKNETNTPRLPQFHIKQKHKERYETHTRSGVMDRKHIPGSFNDPFYMDVWVNDHV